MMQARLSFMGDPRFVGKNHMACITSSSGEARETLRGPTQTEDGSAVGGGSDNP
jgi:hypothetical protein